MITPNTIKSVMKLIAAAANLPFVRAEQDGERPAPPFISYKVLTQEQEGIHTAVIKDTPKEGDGTTLIRTTERKAIPMISVSIFGNVYGELWEHADRIVDYIESGEGKEACLALGIYPKMASPQVEDRTVYLETGFEHRVGFDVALAGLKTIVSEIGALDLEASIGDIASTI